jgi:hypothetical protein
MEWAGDDGKDGSSRFGFTSGRAGAAPALGRSAAILPT